MFRGVRLALVQVSRLSAKGQPYSGTGYLRYGTLTYQATLLVRWAFRLCASCCTLGISVWRSGQGQPIMVALAQDQAP